MRRNEAKRRACHIVSMLIEGQLGVGWDLSNHGESAEDTEKIERGIREIADEMYARAIRPGSQP